MYIPGRARARAHAARDDKRRWREEFNKNYARVGREWEEFQASLTPAAENPDLCHDVAYVTEVSLVGWLFPGPWADGRMKGARYCQGATLGLCARDHLHATVSAGGEKAVFQCYMAEKVIHVPVQQVDLAAAIVMEASPVDENILQRYVSGCRVTNTDAVVEWCQAPFCGRRHRVLVDMRFMSGYSLDSQEEDVMMWIPWALPSAVPGRPVELRNHSLREKHRKVLVERLTRDEGAVAVRCDASTTPGPSPEPWKVHLNRNWGWEERTRQMQPTILTGSEMAKDVEHYNEFQNLSGGEGTKRQRVSPKKVFDVATGTAIPCTPGMEYAALSYVWAQHSEKTTISLLRRLGAELGIRYWWVDRLCMTTAQDKADEIPLMAEYYKNAATTVIYDRDMASESDTTISTRRLWTAGELSSNGQKQEFLLASRILVATKIGFIEGYRLGSWEKAIGWKGIDCFSFELALWYAIHVGPTGLARRTLKPVLAFDGLGPSNYTLSSPAPFKLSLGAPWKRAEGRACTRQEDLVYGMMALLGRAEKMVVEYDIGWAELMRRCCQWGLVESDVLTSDQICSDEGMCWAPRPDGNQVPRLTDWEMTPVPVALVSHGCEVCLPRVGIQMGPMSAKGGDMWGTLTSGGTDYSAKFSGFPHSKSAEYTGLVVAARFMRLLVILTYKQGTDGNIFHKVGLCEVLINEDDDDVRDVVAEKTIVGHRRKQMMERNAATES